MKIHVRLAEPFWRAVGLREIVMDIDPSSCANDLLLALQNQYPKLSREFDQTPPHIFIEDVEGTGNSLLTDGAHVHLVWPIAGG